MKLVFLIFLLNFEKKVIDISPGYISFSKLSKMQPIRLYSEEGITTSLWKIVFLSKKNRLKKFFVCTRRAYFHEILDKNYNFNKKKNVIICFLDSWCLHFIELSNIHGNGLEWKFLNFINLHPNWKTNFTSWILRKNNKQNFQLFFPFLHASRWVNSVEAFGLGYIALQSIFFEFIL